MTDCIHLNYIDEAVYFEFARGNPNIIALRDLQTSILKIRSLLLISYQVLCTLMECLFDFKNGITSNKFPFSDKKGGKNENLFNTPR